MLVTLRAGSTVTVHTRRQRPGEAGRPARLHRRHADGLSRPSQPHGSRYPIARVPAPSVPAAGWTPQEDERAEQDVLT